jgi:hypothetical protein
MGKSDCAGRTVHVFFREPFAYGGKNIVHVSGKCGGLDGDLLVITKVAQVYIDQRIEPIESPLCGLELFCSMHNISVVIPEGTPEQ